MTKKRDGDYVVGYGRPPNNTKFKKGQSGNPKGRPKTPKTVGAILRKVLGKKVRIQGANGLSRVSALEGVILNLAQDALRKDPKAIMNLIKLAQRIEEQQSDGDAPSEDLTPEDLEIIAAFQKRPGTNLKKSKKPKVSR